VQAEERPLLFGKFTRLSARPTGGEISTGLGLHIVHELVEAMGGTVRYEEGPRGGACFVVTLPLVSGAQGKP
jgi:signal transduction histidine kinase